MVDATITASSNASEENSISVLSSQSKDSFLTGIRVKKSWIPDPNDKNPTLNFIWDKPQIIQSILIKEGNVIIHKYITDFKISARIDDLWKEIHRGKSIGSFFGLTLEEPIVATAIKIEILDDTKVEINKIGIFSKLKVK
jgi:hypothetical protein